MTNYLLRQKIEALPLCRRRRVVCGSMPILHQVRRQAAIATTSHATNVRAIVDIGYVGGRVQRRP